MIVCLRWVLIACFYTDSSTLILVVLNTIKIKMTLHTQRLRCWSPLPSVVRKLWTLHAPPKRYKLQTQVADREKQQFCPWFSDTRLHCRTWNWAPSIVAVAANRNSLNWITRRRHVPTKLKLDRLLPSVISASSQGTEIIIVNKLKDCSTEHDISTDSIQDTGYNILKRFYFSSFSKASMSTKWIKAALLGDLGDSWPRETEFEKGNSAERLGSHSTAVKRLRQYFVLIRKIYSRCSRNVSKDM